MPDLIKLDVHSAEWEALVGASHSLNYCSAVLVETWHCDIHKGQKLHGDVEKFLNDNGFYLYDLRMASRWKKKSSSGIKDRKILVGSESVFFKLKPVPGKELEFVCLLDIFGFTVTAIERASEDLEAHIARRIIKFIEDNNRLGLVDKIKFHAGNKALKIRAIRGLFTTMISGR
jgi:hypothetical protein